MPGRGGGGGGDGRRRDGGGKERDRVGKEETGKKHKVKISYWGRFS